MKNVKTFNEWLNEDFAMVGVPPAGNLGTGMGAVETPNDGKVGSGDQWPSLGAPATQICTNCGKKFKKKCKCTKKPLKKED